MRHARRYLFLYLLLPVILLPVGMSAQSSASLSLIPRDTVAISLLIRSARALPGQYTDSALILVEQAMRLSSDVRYENGVLNAASYLSKAYAARGMTERFEATFRNTLAVCERKKMNKALPQIYIGIGYTSLMMGRNEEAIQYYYQAIAAAEKYATPAALGFAYNNIASVSPDYWSIDQAMFYLRKAEVIARQNNEHELMVYTLINKGYIYTHHNQTKPALLYYKQALDTARKYGLTSQEYLISTNIGGLALKNNKPAEALRHLLRAQSLKGDIYPSYRCLSSILLGNAYFDLHEYAKAETVLLKVIQTVSTEKTGMIYLPDAYESLAKAYYAMGNYKQAYLGHRSYSRIKDSLQDKKLSENINQLEVKYRTAQKDKEIILNQLKISRQENFIRKKNIWIGGVSLGILFLSILLVSFYHTNKHKRRAQAKLIQFLQQEQKALQQRQAMLNQEQEINQLKAVIEGEERERSRIGRELHDGIGGMLSAINMNLNAIQKRYHQLRALKELNLISKMLDDTSSEVRKAAHNLMPDVLIRHSLKEALVIYCDYVEHSLPIDLQIYGDLDLLSKGHQLTFYRMIQELVQNMIKHARASTAVVQIMQYEEQFSITVEDNGVGFNDNEIDSGYGLQNLRFRVQALKGEISIMSGNNKGTTIYMVFPIRHLLYDFAQVGHATQDNYLNNENS